MNMGHLRLPLTLALFTSLLSPNVGCEVQKPRSEKTSDSASAAEPEPQSTKEPQRAPEPPPKPAYTDLIIDRETTKSGSIKRVKWHLGEDGEPCRAQEYGLYVTKDDDTISWEVQEDPMDVSVNEYSLMKAVRTLGSPRRMVIIWCDGLNRYNRYLILDRPSQRVWQTTVYDRKWR